MTKKNKKKEPEISKLKLRWNYFIQWRQHIQEKQRNGKTIPRTDPAKCTEIVCLNCGHPFRGHFCPNCGQNADTKRITMRTAIRSLVVTLVGGDSLFIRTCGNLIYRPGFMIHDFLCGKRERYFRPVQLLLCLVTIFALISFLFKDSLSLWNDLQISDPSLKDNNDTFAQASLSLKKLLSNEVTFSLFFAFIMVFPFHLLFKRKTLACPDGENRRMNTAEHFITLIYLSCLNLIFGLILLPLHCIPQADTFLNFLDFFLMLFLSTWVYRQLFNLGWFNCLWRNVLAMSMVLCILLMLFLLYFGIYYGIAAVVM